MLHFRTCIVQPEIECGLELNVVDRVEDRQVLRRAEEPRMAGQAGQAPRGAKVDLVWKEHVDQALAVLHTMREPDEQMASAGNAETWTKMVETAIAEVA